MSASLLGASILTVSETVVLPDGSLAPFDRLDGEQMGVSPAHRLFVCEDGFLAVHAQSEASLRAALSVPTEADSAAALLGSKCDDAVRVLARAGIDAERVALDQMNAFLDDPRNRAIDLAVRYPHAAYGEVAQIGSLWQLEPARPSFPRSAPVVGEHTREILHEVGLSKSEIDSLVENGVVVSRRRSWPERPLSTEGRPLAPP